MDRSASAGGAFGTGGSRGRWKVRGVADSPCFQGAPPTVTFPPETIPASFDVPSQQAQPATLTAPPTGVSLGRSEFEAKVA